MSAPFQHITAEEYRTMKQPKASKYGARRTVVDGIKFASEKEARRYSELLILLRSNKIGFLERQPEFILHAAGGKIVGRYFGDFRYLDKETDEVVVEDVKSKATAGIALYRWKKNHVLQEYAIRIREV